MMRVQQNDVQAVCRVQAVTWLISAQEVIPGQTHYAFRQCVSDARSQIHLHTMQPALRQESRYHDELSIEHLHEDYPASICTQLQNIVGAEHQQTASAGVTDAVSGA